MQNNNNNINYDNYTDQPVDQNTGEVMNRNNNQQMVNVDDDPLYLAPTTNQKGLLKKVEQFAELSGRTLNGTEKLVAFENSMQICKLVNEKEGPNGWDKVSAKESQLVGQLLAVSKLGLTFKKSEVWLDIRGNKNSPKRKDINIKYQYQGLEKIMLKYCSFDIHHFLKKVVCKGDVFEMEVDIATGFDKLSKYVPTKEAIDRDDLNNIIGAFEIAYTKEKDGSYSQYVGYVNKNRILRAKDAASTKIVWNKDTTKMVLKTAVHELYTNLAPYMKTTDEVLRDLEMIEDEMDFGSKETKFSDSISVETNVKEEVATEQIEDDL